MKKVLSLTAIFIATTMLAVQFRNSLRREHIGNDERSEKLENGRGDEHESDGPEEFIKFHQGIRTRSDEQRPGYAANYQWTELQKARYSSAKKTTLAARTQSGGGNGVISYTERGPGNVPGRTRGLVVDPDDASHNTWFAGSASGGIWKTTDGGNSWLWLTPSIPNLATTSLAMAGSNHNTIYAGTGE